ncbi:MULTISPECIES: hypothetical protein [unclassified Streptococcus]|uniref:hypothetical protein n=1 Tax=unclassified Streptococcus TaxID=2608887 RepID=UPI001071F8F6|nr:MULTISPECIES: hypothetical protein [unclassified Streptococcus]MBF0805337.1 hypothetical protein [Streptococcus sp. 19428wA2_WM07]TFU29178.1 hypothetical protein E4T71_00745 [Streptococcus sp. WM07]
MDKAFFEERMERLRNRTDRDRQLGPELVEMETSQIRKIRRKRQKLLNLEMAKCSKKIQHQDEQKTQERIHQEKNRFQKICRGNS